MRKIWDKFVSFVADVAVDKLLHFIAGMLIAAFFYIVFGMVACLVPVFFFAFAKECWDSWYDGNKFDGWDLVATLAGGLTIQVLVISHELTLLC